MGAPIGQQVIKCKVSECLHWDQGDNCDLKEIWVARKPGASGSGIMNAVTGGGNPITEQDTFCASYDQRR